jgi:hypothetical protein
VFHSKSGLKPALRQKKSRMNKKSRLRGDWGFDNPALNKNGKSCQIFKSVVLIFKMVPGARIELARPLRIKGF